MVVMSDPLLPSLYGNEQCSSNPGFVLIFLLSHSELYLGYLPVPWMYSRHKWKHSIIGKSKHNSRAGREVIVLGKFTRRKYVRWNMWSPCYINTYRGMWKPSCIVRGTLGGATCHLETLVIYMGQVRKHIQKEILIWAYMLAPCGDCLPVLERRQDCPGGGSR